MSFGPQSSAAGLSGTVSQSEVPSPLRITPLQFKIEVTLNSEQIVELSLQNTDSVNSVAFKIKTTARERYSLRPTQDILPPNTTRSCKIVCNKFSSVPESAAQSAGVLKDKFLIQSIAVSNASGIADLTKFWRELEAVHNAKDNAHVYNEQRIKCKLSFPSASAAGSINADSVGKNIVTAAGEPLSATGLQQIAEESEGKDLADTAEQHSSSNMVGETALNTSISTMTAPSSASKRLQSEDAQKRKEFDELTDVVVRLTQQLEQMKQENQLLTNKYSSAQQNISSLNEQVQSLSSVASSALSDDSELRQRKSASANVPAASPSPSPPVPFTAPASTVSAGSIALKSWQWIIVAIMFFVLGRIFS